MFEQERRERLRMPVQRVGTLENGALPPPSDEQLLSRALIDRDDRALDEVLDRLSPSMLHVAMTHVRSRAEAEDVVQETWIGALRSIERFEHRSSLRTWLFRILRNRARTRGTRLARMVPFSEFEPESGLRGLDAVERMLELGSGRELAEQERQVLNRELRNRIDQAIEALPQRQRTVVTMRDVDGMSAAEVASALGLTDGNQRILLHRARARIRDELATYLDDDAAEAPLRLAG